MMNPNNHSHPPMMLHSDASKPEPRSGDFWRSPGWTAWLLALAVLMGLQALGAKEVVLAPLAFGISLGLVGLPFCEAWIAVKREATWPQTYSAQELVAILKQFLREFQSRPPVSAADAVERLEHLREQVAPEEGDGSDDGAKPYSPAFVPPGSPLGWATDLNDDTNPERGRKVSS